MSHQHDNPAGEKALAGTHSRRFSVWLALGKSAAFFRVDARKRSRREPFVGLGRWRAS
jgi:hypothetical protein